MSTKTTSEYTKDVLAAVGKIKELHNSFPNANLKEYFEIIIRKVQKLEERLEPIVETPLHNDFEYLAEPFLELSIADINIAVESVILKISKENKARLESKRNRLFTELKQEEAILETFNHNFNTDGLQ